ncbi:hypothetical protein, partial [Aetokthonos hydrillicola]|uniref:hypothetical protein n=1 Tax=Aetokthonos hydrillicola TaxID=1550245 RepID=UPI001ABB40E5
ESAYGHLENGTKYGHLSFYPSCNGEDMYDLLEHRGWNMSLFRCVFRIYVAMRAGDYPECSSPPVA